MDKQLRIGVIGAGRIGKLHADNLVNRVPGAKLEAVSDVNLQAAKDLANKHGVTKVFDDYNQLLTDPEVDAVFICASTDMHYPISIAAAKAGKHIFCEKPIDHDLGRIEEVLAEVKKAGVKYQVGFNRRFDRNFKHVRKLSRTAAWGMSTSSR